MEKDHKKYIPDIKLVYRIQKEFSGDLHTELFDEEYDFNTYICALAYGSIGKELFFDPNVSENIPADMKKNKVFMQGMLQYSIIKKINKATSILNSAEFKKTKKIDFSLEDKIHDYATIAFVIYYLTTQGYKVQWDKMSHNFSPINMENGLVEFTKSKKINPTELLESVDYDIKHRSLIQ
ncbi:MAG: hypothetical protein IKM43_00025 [Clostridia bacterium]|nr:hypothetical protein [Clostridia bacterium]